MNLLEETKEILKECGQSPYSVEFVCFIHPKDKWEKEPPVHEVSWAKFAEAANEEYDEGFGGVEVNDSFFIVGKDWWLERHEYDGSEWWEFKKVPISNGNTFKGSVKEALFPGRNW